MEIQIGHLTAIVSHRETWHFLFNATLICVSFPVAVYYTDVRRALFIFTAGGILGGIVFSIVGGLFNYLTPVMGSSGAVFALLSSFLILGVDKIKSQEMLRRSAISAGFVIVEILRATATQQSILAADSWFVNLVHITGAITGYGIALLIIYRE